MKEDLKILFHKKYLTFNLQQYFKWNPSKTPHAILVGATGSGKTYLSKLTLGKIALNINDSQLYVCDFKGDDDFSFLEDCPRFYRYTNCSKGLQEFYERFQKRQRKEELSKNAIFLFFDEWASYCNNLDKKVLEEEKKKLSILLMLGRSFNMYIIISQQRADATYFNSARENFNLVIGLGNLTKESKDMLFYDFKDEIRPVQKQGTGYALVNGAKFTEIQVPKITNMKKLESTIRKGVLR